MAQGFKMENAGFAPMHNLNMIIILQIEKKYGK